MEDPTDYEHQIFKNTNLPKATAPDNGVFVSGLYFEGAKWDQQRKLLVESDEKVLYQKSPIIWFKPVSFSK